MVWSRRERPGEQRSLYREGDESTEKRAFDTVDEAAAGAGDWRTHFGDEGGTCLVDGRIRRVQRQTR